MDKSNFNWKKYIDACLASTQYCSLATFGKEGVWCNPVYFAWNEQYDLYFISMPHSRHMHNISENSFISVAVYSTEQDTLTDVCGLQIKGEAFLLEDKDVPAAHKVYYHRVYPDGNHNKKPEENIGLAEWRFVKIMPSEMYYFDTRFFGEQRQQVPLQELAKLK